MFEVKEYGKRKPSMKITLKNGGRWPQWQLKKYVSMNLKCYNFTILLSNAGEPHIKRNQNPLTLLVYSHSREITLGCLLSPNHPFLPTLYISMNMSGHP